MDNNELLNYLIAEAAKAKKYGEQANFEDERGYWLGACTALVETIARVDGIGFLEANGIVEDYLDAQ